MSNKSYAYEWLLFSLKNLNTAKLLYDVNHYEDIIGIEIQQALEKALKSLLAYENKKIPKSHKLVELLVYVDLELNDNEKFLLEIATDYYKVDRYPNPNYSLPSRVEIKEVLNFTEKLFDKICIRLKIDGLELINE
jgi:HEPN domain-containing protein